MYLKPRLTNISWPCALGTMTGARQTTPCWRSSGLTLYHRSSPYTYLLPDAGWRRVVQATGRVTARLLHLTGRAAHRQDGVTLPRLPRGWGCTATATLIPALCSAVPQVSVREQNILNSKQRSRLLCSALPLQA